MALLSLLQQFSLSFRLVSLQVSWGPFQLEVLLQVPDPITYTQNRFHINMNMQTIMNMRNWHANPCDSALTPDCITVSSNLCSSKNICIQQADREGHNTGKIYVLKHVFKPSEQYRTQSEAFMQ